jgi:hypothetical protein
VAWRGEYKCAVEMIIHIINDFNRKECVGVNWINLAQDKDQ